MTEKLPTEIKALKGTLRPSREFKGLEAGARLSAIPEAPGTLSDGGKDEWAGLAPVLVDIGVLTYADLRALELLCETLATATELESTIKREGFTIAAATGGHKAHPALKALETARNASHRMLNDFGLSPKARKYVSQAPGKRADNPFSKFTRRPERGNNPFAELDDDE